jgi:hypothetical protein
MRILQSDSTAYKVQFDSITEYAHYCADTPADQGSNDTSQRRHGHDWDLGLSFDDAITACKRGGYWPEGAEKLQAVSLGNFNPSDYIPDYAIDLGVMGGGVDTGEYLAGSPECFNQLIEDKQSRKVITLDVLSVCAGIIKADNWLNYGRAILALVDTLEMQNYSVELRSTYCAGTDAQCDIQASIVVKHAGEQWSAGTVAYALAHPAFFRRLGFKFTETAPNDLAHKATSDGSYGKYQHLRHWTGSQGADIYFPYQTDERLFNTPEKAIKHVMAIAHDQQPNLIKGSK